MKKVIAIALAVAAFTSVSLAFADELAVKPEGTRETWKQEKVEFQQKRMQIAQDFKTKMADWRTERQQALENLKQEKLKLREQFKEKFTAERCAKIQERINNKSARFEDRKEKHATVYANLLARVDKFIKRFEDFNAANPDKKVDITKLKADRDQLAKLIEDFKTSYSEYFSKWSVAKNFKCDGTEGKFRTTIVDAKAYLKGVHETAASIRKFMKETILPDMLEVKKQIAKARGENESEADNDESDDSSNQ